MGTHPKDDVARGMKRYSTVHGSLKSPYYLKNSKDLGVNVICILSLVTRGASDKAGVQSDQSVLSTNGSPSTGPESNERGLSTTISEEYEDMLSCLQVVSEDISSAQLREYFGEGLEDR